MTCTFFGHRDTPPTVKPLLRQVIMELIEQRGVTRFYVGNQGNFDAMAHSLLAELAQTYPIHYDVVLAYLPKENDPSLDGSHTILPDGFEAVPLRFAIDHKLPMTLEDTTPENAEAARLYLVKQAEELK